MLYLLGGAARSGKSRAASKFKTVTGIPFFGLDYLMMGLTRGLPEYGIDPEEGDRLTASKLWPVVEGMALAYIENEEDYLLEGVCLLPEYVAQLASRIEGPLRACFIGFAEVDPAEKLYQIRRFGGIPGDWLKEYDDERALRTIESLKRFSFEIRDECERYNLRYFEILPDHSNTMHHVVQYLIDGE